MSIRPQSLLIIPMLCAAAVSQALAQGQTVSSGSISRSTIVDLKQTQEQLTSLTRDLHQEPIDAIRQALTAELQGMAELRRQIDREPHNRSLVAQFDNSLSKILAKVDNGLERLIDGEPQVMQAIDQNLAATRGAHERAVAELRDVQSRRVQIEPHKHRREEQLRKMLAIYGSESELPEDLLAQAEQLRNDIRTLDRLGKAMSATERERQRLIDSLAKFQRELQTGKHQVGVTYHAAVGHRNVVLHLVEYRSARADRVKTEAEIRKFSEQLTQLLQSIGDSSFGELVDLTVEQ